MWLAAYCCNCDSAGGLHAFASAAISQCRMSINCPYEACLSVWKERLTIWRSTAMLPWNMRQCMVSNRGSVTSRVEARFFLWMTKGTSCYIACCSIAPAISGLDLLCRLLPGCQMLDMSFPAWHMMSHQEHQALFQHVKQHHRADSDPFNGMLHLKDCCNAGSSTCQQSAFCLLGPRTTSGRWETRVPVGPVQRSTMTELEGEMLLT